MRWTSLLPMLLLAACRGEPEPAPAPFDVPQTLRVITADTFELNGERLRLANVSLPQPAPAARCWGEAALARQAYEQMIRAPLYASDVQRVGRDPDGATRVTISSAGDDVGEGLRDRGLAARYSPAGWDWCGHSADYLADDGPLLSIENSGARLRARIAAAAAR